ncbi:MAG: hypothetical protein E7133_07775 [Rikenellaceae bacterium]|nr:hypothetical protein [Rikenellaceae bacterium]
MLFAQEAGITQVSLRESEPAPATVEQTKPQSRQKSAPPRRRKIDFMADEVHPYNRGGDSVVCFVGNFAAHHNGAVISCDSAVRFSDARWGFYDKVIINQDSIYIYGDSAVYDGNLSLAEVYAPIVKVVDGDALLYTYNFTFNTATKIGRYSEGGVLVQDNDILESYRGYYYANEHDIICVDKVEVHGSDYDLKSDSVIYNTETKFARFFTNTEIWNVDGDYLSAEEGTYDHARNVYNVTRDGYILTAEQEIWGDTLTYDRANEHITARRNIQMDDFENKVLAVGDYGEYWKMDGRAILTKEPIAISYDTTEGDTIFMRADTMWFETRNREEDKRMEVIKAREDSIRMVEEARRKAEEAAAAKAKALEEAAAREKEYEEAQARKAEEARLAAEKAAAEQATADATETPQSAEVATTATPDTPQPTTQTVEVVESDTTAMQTVTEADAPAEDAALTEATDAEGVETTTEEVKAEGDVAPEDKAETETSEVEAAEGGATLPVDKIDEERDSAKKEKLKKRREKRKKKGDDTAEDTSQEEQLPMTAADSLMADSLARQDSIRMQLALDSIVNDSLYPDSILTPTQLEARMEKRKADAKAEELRRKAEERRMFLDSIAKQRQAKMIAQYERERAFELRQIQKDSVRRAKKRARRIARGKDVSELDMQDSIDAMKMEELRKEIVVDTTSTEQEEEFDEAPLTDSVAVDTLPPDSIYRLVKAYRNVRIFRSDAQAVCDSMVGNSTDSVMRMYIEPVLWNNLNQIAAAQVDMYTKNQKLERVEFMENPIMIAEIDTTYYNQVTGKKMIAYFRDNDIYRNDVDGNVQTIYFQQESEQSKIVTDLIYLESASASFYLEKQELKGITYRNDVPFTIYPLALIPADQPTRLPNFKWVPELRPEREEFIIEGLRPSLRERKASRNRPTFRIVNRMDRDKERFIRRGTWVDREDQLKPDIVEWRNTRTRE